MIMITMKMTEPYVTSKEEERKTLKMVFIQVEFFISNDIYNIL